MTNFQVYRKTLLFSIVEFLIGLVALAILVGCCTAGFFIMNNSTDKAIIGLVIGLVIGIILVVLINIFITNRIKAAQIGMMAKGVVDGKLPDNIFKEGLAEVRGRFAKLTLFFMVMGAIKGMFRQLGRAINKLGTAVGGQVGDSVTSVIDSAIQIVIGYLADCCLGWVMYNKKKGVAEAACEGAVIFFKRGKTLIINIGRIFGLGLLSLVVIGGALFGLGYLILKNFPNMFVTLGNEIQEIANRNGSTAPDFVTNPTLLTIYVAALGAVILWSMIHSLLIRPFILVGVLRNFMKAGLEEKISNSDFDTLESKSPRFAKMRKSISAS